MDWCCIGSADPGTTDPHVGLPRADHTDSVLEHGPSPMVRGPVREPSESPQVFRATFAGEVRTDLVLCGHRPKSAGFFPWSAANRMRTVRNKSGAPVLPILQPDHKRTSPKKSYAPVRPILRTCGHKFLQNPIAKTAFSETRHSGNDRRKVKM